IGQRPEGAPHVLAYAGGRPVPAPHRPKKRWKVNNRGSGRRKNDGLVGARALPGLERAGSEIDAVAENRRSRGMAPAGHRREREPGIGLGIEGLVLGIGRGWRHLAAEHEELALVDRAREAAARRRPRGPRRPGVWPWHGT